MQINPQDYFRGKKKKNNENTKANSTIEVSTSIHDSPSLTTTRNIKFPKQTGKLTRVKTEPHVTLL
jgi:hypothetical protein